MKRLIISIFLGFCSSALGATYTAASCNQSDVQTAITNELASAADGDVISIPSGTCTWSGSTMTARFAHSVTIQGAGAISSTSGGASTTGSDLTAITNGIGQMIQFATTSGKSFRFTGIAILGSTYSAANGALEISGASAAVRVDHCHFYVSTGEGVGVRLDGSVLGVADHNYFSNDAGSIDNDIAIHNGEGWGGSSESGNAVGDHSWADTDHFGTSEFFFVEDNQFSNGDIGDAHDGARYVLRYNTMVETSLGSAGQMYNHGLTNARGRATRAVEVYMNAFTQPGTTGQNNPVYAINSGTLLFWGNTITQYRNAVSIDYTRRSNGTYTYAAPPNGWGYCGTAYGPTNWDQNTNSYGYACLDAAARGAGDLLEGDFPSPAGAGPGVCDETQGCPNYTGTRPNQTIDPIYLWNNTFTPAGGYSLTGMVTLLTPMYNDNVDLYQQFGANAESGTFNGTAGVGQGSSLPSVAQSTCTPSANALASGTTWLGVSVSGYWGPGYWDTTNSTLYVCTATNTWTAYYTPYTYPNPLTSGGDPPGQPTAPTNLVVTVH